MGIREGQSEQIDMIMTAIWLINESIQCVSMLRYRDYYEKNNMISELQSERAIDHRPSIDDQINQRLNDC